MRPKGTKNKNPAMAHVNIRLSPVALEYFKKLGKKSSVGYTIAMRRVLEKEAGVTPSTD